MRRLDRVAWAGLAVTIVVNGLQGGRILWLEKALESPTANATLVEGMAAPPLEARDAAGRIIRIDYHEGPNPTLVYLFLPGCVWCRRNMRSIDALARQTEGRVRTLAVSLSPDGLEEFRSRSGWTFPAYAAEPATAKAYRTATPTTILVAKSGAIMKVWTGVYAGSTREAVARLFRDSSARFDGALRCLGRAASGATCRPG